MIYVACHESATSLNQKRPNCKPCSIQYIDLNVSIQDSMRYPYGKDNLKLSNWLLEIIYLLIYTYIFFLFELGFLYNIFRIGDIYLD
jgi:hypothetical protein